MILIHSPRQVKDITYHLIHISIHMFFWAHYTLEATCAHLHSNRSQCAATALYIMVSSGWLYELQCWEGGGDRRVCSGRKISPLDLDFGPLCAKPWAGSVRPGSGRNLPQRLGAIHKSTLTRGFSHQAPTSSAITS